MKEKYIKRLICTCIVLTISMAAFYMFHIPAKTELKYCEEIAYSINLLNLKCYRCNTIEKYNSEIVIFFSLKNNNLFYEDADLGIYDMMNVKSYLENYLSNNPQSPLTNDKISVCFQTHPADAMFMYNYDYREDKPHTIHSDFLFFNNLESKNFSALENFDDVYVMKIYSENIDSLDFLNRWKNLSYLSINSLDLTDEDILKIKKIVPDCEIDM